MNLEIEKVYLKKYTLCKELEIYLRKNQEINADNLKWFYNAEEACRIWNYRLIKTKLNFYLKINILYIYND